MTTTIVILGIDSTPSTHAKWIQIRRFRLCQQQFTSQCLTTV